MKPLKQSIAEFAAKLDRLPAEIREMSGVHPITVPSTPAEIEACLIDEVRMKGRILNKWVRLAREDKSQPILQKRAKYRQAFILAKAKLEAHRAS